MSEPEAPSVEARRASDFESELLARARAWVPAWGADDPQDFGRALLRVAARFNSEVAQRLDQVGEKAYRGFFDWLAVRGDAARPARMPVVFKLADPATDAVLARAPVSMQADAGSASVNFETEDDVLVLPGQLAAIVGADADADAIYLQIPGMTSLDPLPPLPTQWRLKSFAAAGSATLQLDPQVGLAPDMIVAIAGAQYRLVTVAKDIVTIDPPLPGSGAGLAVGTPVDQVTAFAPFDPATRNRQMHALYLGHADLLNIDSAATIDIVGADALGTLSWSYWGKAGTPGDVVTWQSLKPADKQPPGALRLVKGLGSVEMLEVVPGKSARWIAAFAAHVDGSTPLLSGGPLQIEINADNATPACPLSDPSKAPQIAADAFANTTPITLGTVFYPLGKLPRQFDAFYLGCPEAFSKTGASVQLCFQMSDLSADSFSVVHGGAFADKVLASVGNDGALHLYSFDPAQQTIAPLYGRDPLQPPSPASGGAQSTLPAVALDPKPTWRLPIWTAADARFHLPIDFRVAVAAGPHVWVWAEAALDRTQSGWIDFGDTGASAGIDALVYLDDPGKPQLVALHDGVLTFRGIDPNATWGPPVTPMNAGVAVQLDIIAPVLSNASGQLVTSVGNGLVGIDSNEKLYAIDTHPLTAGACTLLPGLPPNLTAKVQPIAFLAGGGIGAFAVADTPLAPLTTLVWLPPGAAAVSMVLANNGTVVGGSLEAALDGGGNFTAVVSVLEGSNSYLLTWTPGSLTLYEPINVPSATVAGAPAVIGQNMVIPAGSTDILIGSFAQPLTGDIEAGIVVPSSTPTLSIGDVVTIGIGAGTTLQHIYGSAVTLGNETFYPMDPGGTAFPQGLVTRELLAYQMSTPTTAAGAPTAAGTLTLHAGELRVSQGSSLFIKVTGVADPGRECLVTNLAAGGVATVAPATLPLGGTGANYYLPIHTGGRPAPCAILDATLPAQQCTAALLAEGQLIFPGKTPESQNGEAFGTAGPFVTLAVMDAWWGAAPYPLGPGSGFFVSANWTLQKGDITSSPDLSWEYWNGAWSKLPLTADGTQNLKSTGAVSFVTPVDITSSDWAGKTSFWIRARLIGGDYGTEQVTVITKDLGGGVTQQTIERSTSGIKPPVVVSLAISYALTAAVTPTYLLAQDSGSIHDESDANRTAGASVEAFVPLSLTLGRLSGSGGTITSSDGACPPDCACPPNPTCPPGCDCPPASGSTSSGAALSPGRPAAATSSSTAPAVVPATGRSLFLGFDAAVGGASVNLLFMVAVENNHDALAPLTVEALVGDHFVPVVVADGTRALGESGILTLAFGESPTMVELFGQTLNWLEITPSPKDATAAAAWSPNLSGIYLNAAWASATETLTRELLGSSVGEPNLTLTLQRPPLLAGSLQLRVNEPLGDEDLKALLEEDAAKVVTDDPNLPGDWVLWTQVDDPGDWGPTDRVYALEEATGTITFGDGQAGAIPPVGTDSIVAFWYQRTEPPAAGAIDVPANSITARTQLNLVTPVATVEAVYSADHAAGGAPPEPDARVLKVGGTALRNRGRAVTAIDLEDLTLASSVDIAQARAIVSAQGTRLIVVMRGPNPAPSRAQRRELTRLMLTVTPVAFTAAQALTIEAPVIRRLRISLRLSVDTLDHAGAVAAAAESNIEAFLDTLTGGRTGDGWPLGTSPTADDVALALLDIADLVSIEDISLAEALADGAEGAWPATLQVYELAQLDSDALRFQFDSVEQFA
ncbi:MAG: hypothetical protein KGO22_06770 [Gammaproteobacteria bacterium]|nr:hypothetical protein [Gammaproteobacteria bacterium]